MTIRHLEQHTGAGIFHVDGRNIATKEGLSAVDEAIAFVKAVKPMPPLKPSKGLSEAAVDHALDIGPKGLVSHDGTDGRATTDRAARHGQWLKTIGENIAFGHGGARQIVAQLIIDDGVPERGHRTNIFARQYGVAGVAIRPHREYGTCCVIDYAGGFRER